MYKVKSVARNKKLVMYSLDDDLINSNTTAFDPQDDAREEDILFLPMKDVSSVVYVKLRDKGNVKVNYLQCNSRNSRSSSNSFLSSTPSSSSILNKSEMSTHLTRLADLLGLEHSQCEFISKKCKLATYTKDQIITTTSSSSSSSSSKISLIVDGSLTLQGEHGLNTLHQISKGHLLGAGILS